MNFSLAAAGMAVRCISSKYCSSLIAASIAHPRKSHTSLWPLWFARGCPLRENSRGPWIDQSLKGSPTRWGPDSARHMWAPCWEYLRTARRRHRDSETGLSSCTRPEINTYKIDKKKVRYIIWEKYSSFFSELFNRRQSRWNAMEVDGTSWSCLGRRRFLVPWEDRDSSFSRKELVLPFNGFFHPLFVSLNDSISLRLIWK